MITESVPWCHLFKFNPRYSRLRKQNTKTVKQIYAFRLTHHKLNVKQIKLYTCTQVLSYAFLHIYWHLHFMKATSGIFPCVYKREKCVNVVFTSQI